MSRNKVSGGFTEWFRLCFSVKTISILTVGIAIILAGCQKPVPGLDESVSEPTEWSHTWIVNTNDSIMPKVLLVGDSHVEAYYSFVAKNLGTNISVSKFTSSRCLGDPFYIDQLELVLKQFQFDVISFNNGLHGKDYSEVQYKRDIPKVYDLFKKYSVKKVVWVNTTPVRNSDALDLLDSDFNNKVIERNRNVEKFTMKNNIPLVDLYSMGLNDPNLYKGDGVHFNVEGVKQEAQMVGEAIQEII